jgi:hypothetical protein
MRWRRRDPSEARATDLVRVDVRAGARAKARVRVGVGVRIGVRVAGMG